ncbi:MULTISPECIES: hypothetical protein [unclassified Mycolicibacterium]|uniref:hypothetical protein n=1 Tax=unclassified Mycolicibacterium TaxID=2636767 RepID=UPI0012DF8A11|nr:MULTISPECIES: hypothetical protein [unclassified Mycolicibacterium]MUL85007.1 hypothetical protein [Mycolicibacterium sp. CBMA 329]MUL90974.1 hypothetical protein [Mycolicibacterium sp. CBMA 331]MUL98355.1 hypothetical protein [Mycolicibacterium sp. CBMA 334]MUM28592.1 hypothetical protein [Mycolicibacterium sp. CBMA 295]MUM40733.1 hypothetical protein [Mycolicibacterium sp. CBMA 247]
MQIAARSYLAAGVALIGAGAIAVTPVAPPVPQVHVPVALTAAIDDPFVVFEPVATATQTLISNVIERQTTNPAPVLRQLVANAVAGAQVFASTDPVLIAALALTHGVITAQEIGPNLAALGQTTSESLTALAAALNTLVTGLPGALQTAGELIAAGKPNEAIDSFVQAGLGPITGILTGVVNPQLNAIGHVLGVPQPIIDAATESSIGLVIAAAISTVGIGVNLPGPQPLVQQFITSTGNVVKAAISGDPVNFVNAVQHGIADFAADVASQLDQTITMGNYIQDSFANALKQITPKPVDFPNPVTPAKALIAPTTLALTTTATVTPELEPATTPVDKTKSAPVSNADNGSGTEAAGAGASGTGTSGTKSGAAEAPATGTTGAAADNATTESGTTKVSTKTSVKGPGKPSAKAGNPAKAVSDQVKSAVQKMTSGLKKDKAGTGKNEASSNDSSKGSDNK